MLCNDNYVFRTNFFTWPHVNLQFQDSLDETDQPDLIMDTGPESRSHLLTDRDPVLGGMQGLCDTAGKISNLSSHYQTCFKLTSEDNGHWVTSIPNSGDLAPSSGHTEIMFGN